MNIDQQLRAALSQEAEMQNAPAPDVDRMISGGRARQGRRRTARFGIAAAVAVLAAGGAYGVMKVHSGTTDTPTRPAPSQSTTPQPYPSGSVVQPGTYRMLVGDGATGAPIHADLTFHGVWAGDNYPVLRDATRRFGGVAVYRPLALAAGTGCLSDQPNSQVSRNPQSLAQQLAQLPRSTVLHPPAPTTAFGRHAVHLRLRINNDCGRDVYRVADTINGGHGISYGHVSHQVLIDFWVENLHRVPVVVETWHEQGASSQLVHQIAQAKDSITFVTGG
jgi:hypothetical protein